MRQSIEFGSQKSRDTAEKLKNIPAATDTREDFERESGSIETEESRRVKVLNDIAENLSPAEERISTPMDKNCKVAVVVPAYGERHAILRGERQPRFCAIQVSHHCYCSRSQYKDNASHGRYVSGMFLSVQRIKHLGFFAGYGMRALLFPPLSAVCQGCVDGRY